MTQAEKYDVLVFGSLSRERVTLQLQSEGATRTIEGTDILAALGRTIFIDPPLARVGLNESQARENAIACRVASLPMDAVWRPWTLSEKRGFMKAVVDAHSDRILGFTAFGPEAGELMGTVQAAMLGGQPFPTLRDYTILLTLPIADPI